MLKCKQPSKDYKTTNITSFDPQLTKKWSNEILTITGCRASFQKMLKFKIPNKHLISRTKIQENSQRNTSNQTTSIQEHKSSIQVLSLKTNSTIYSKTAG